MATFNVNWETPKFNVKDEDIQAKVVKIEALVKHYTALVNDQEAAARRNEETSKRQRADAQRALREEIAKHEQYIREHQENLPATQEQTKQLSDQVQSSRAEYDKAMTQKRGVEQTRNRLIASIERKKAEKRARTTEAGRQLDRTELVATRDASKLKVSGKGDFQNKFVFTCINENIPDQPYSFVLKYGQDRVYSVTKCSPPIDELDDLLAQLQKDGDPLSFIKGMRSAFCKYAATSNSTLLNL